MGMKASNNGTIVTIGTFDGVHIGHQKILKDIVEIGKKQDLKSTVLTLFPHPRMVLHDDETIKLLNTIEERIEILHSIGVDHVEVKTFSREFAQLSAYDYVHSILHQELNARIVVIGYDHHFGKNRSGNIKDLIRYGKEFNFEVKEIKAQQIDDVSVSSTKIRNALFKGDIETANKYLGYPYSLSGMVVKGNKLGRTIGFPTANIKVQANYKLIPGDGVYVVKATIEDTPVYGMMNIGQNPTIPEKDRSIEVHFFNFTGDLYGKELSIKFVHRLRAELKFSSIDALKQQLQEDEKNARQFLNSR